MNSKRRVYVLVLATVLFTPLFSLASCLTGPILVSGICFSDSVSVWGPADWYFSNSLFGSGPGQVGGFQYATDMTNLDSLLQQEYSVITTYTSIRFVNGQTGFDAAATGKLTNLEKFDFLTTLPFLDPNDVPGDDTMANQDLTVKPEVGNGFGPFTIAPPVETPEPGTIILLGTSVFACAGVLRYKLSL